MNNETEQIFILNAATSQPIGSAQKLGGLELPVSSQVNLENVTDFSHVCRTCATITEFVIPIFAGEGLQNNLADKICKHLPIQVCEEDVLPLVVCYQCASTLLAWHELVKCCEQADAALRAKLSTNQQTTKPNTKSRSDLKEEAQSKTLTSDEVEIEETKVQEDDKTKVKIIEKPEFTICENGKRYAKCGVCEKSVSLGSWRRHLRTHRGERRYSCHTCGLAFNDNGNLARHTRALHFKQRPFACPTCRKTFSRKGHLEDHIKSHSESRGFVCDVCGKGSKSGAALRMHRRTHEARRLSCVECGARFKRRGELRAHVSVHTGERAHACACGLRFRLRAHLTAHARAHLSFIATPQYVAPSLEPPEYREPRGPGDPRDPRAAAQRPCTYCTSSHHHTMYKEHLVTAHSDLLFHCEECGKYIDRKDFILHMSLHAVQYTSGQDKSLKRKKIKKKKEEVDVNQNTSEVLGITKAVDTTVQVANTKRNVNTAVQVVNIKRNVSLENEFSDHSETDGFGPLPKSVFEAIEDSQDSQPLAEDASHAPENEINTSQQPAIENDNLSNPALCTQTSNYSNCAVVIERSNISNYVLPVTSANINNPVLPANGSSDTAPAAIDSDPTAEAEKTNQKKTRTCPICHKIYTASSSYFYHMKYFHRGSREHGCEVCGKRFGTRSSLSQHMPIHTGQYEFECKQCQKQFKSKSSLYIHEQTHNGKKSWSCNQCHTSFRWKTHLARHIKRHSAEKGHICTTCGRGFTIRCDLLRHARTHTAGSFTCDKCGQNFAQLRYLKVHSIKQHSTNIVKKSQ